MRISEFFRISSLSAGVVGAIISGQLITGVQAQSGGSANQAVQQQPGRLSQVDSIVLDAQTALRTGDRGKATKYLQAAEALAQQVGATSADTKKKIEALRNELGTVVSGSTVQTLLQARQAVARGDAEAAQTLLAQAEKSGTDFAGASDSPQAVAQLIAKHRDLVALHDSGDAKAFNTEAAKFLMEQGSDMLARGDNQTTIMVVEQAKLFQVDFAALGLDPDKLMAAAKAAPSQAPGTEQPIVAARRLTSMARLAIDRREWDQAKKLVDDAMKLNVPDSQFDADETRPWQLDLVVSKELSRRSVTTVDSQVRGASAEMPVNGSVQQAGYDPTRDTTRNIPVGLSAQADGQQTEEIVPTKTMDAQEMLFRELQREMFSERSIAERAMGTEPRVALDRMVALRGRIAASELKPENLNPLLTIIDSDIREMQRYIEGNLPDIITSEQNAANLDSIELARERKYEVEQQIQKLIDDMNKLLDQQRYSEAEVIGRQISALDPESEIVAALTEKAKYGIRTKELESLKAVREQSDYAAMGPNMEEMATPWDAREKMNFGDTEDYAKRAEMRGDWLAQQQFNSQAERQIWNQLNNSTIQGVFRGTLAETVEQIGAQAGVNIIFDATAMESENISTSKMVDVPISNPISLKSALNIVLGNANLVFVVEDEVIKVTSLAAQKKNLVQKTYYVGDLVFPVSIQQTPSQINFITPSMQMNSPNPMNAMMMGANQPLMNGGITGMNPLAMAQQMPGNPIGGAMAMSALDQYNGSKGPQSPEPIYTTTGPGQMGGITLQNFTPLMNLIQQTIDTDSWNTVGSGEGTMIPFVANLSLVVSNTQAVQDQIQDLLTKLRELNDVQIVVEVRFINLSDQFFERVGVDFDFNINDNSGLTTGQQPGDTVPQSTVIGNVGTGSGFVAPTSLDVGFNQNSFASAVPQFPTFDPSSAANFGFAILSDIEVFFLIQASKGDTRSSVAQSPTVVMFNGQSASINDTVTQPFVTSVTPVVGDFAVAQQPIISILPEGTILNVAAVASNDRRHVTLSLNPFFSQILEVNEFTFDGTRRVVRSRGNLLSDLSNLLDNDPTNDNNIPLEIEQQGVTIQLPNFASTSVSTVVQVPDGGSVLMGGLKRMSEGRTERGVPFLSNIPYVNRLFKNVGIGRQTSNLMMMVTPRIIIQEEEEEIQVGNIGGN